MRIVLLLLLFIPGVAQACDCLGIHIPLEDALCQADTSGILVMEIRLVRQLDGNAAEVTVEDVFIGETDQRRLTLSAIHSCMWYIGGEPVGQRFLYFYRPDPRSAGQGDLFECGFNANIYRIDDSGQQLEYTYTNGGHDGINAGLRYRPFRHMLQGSACELVPGLITTLSSPLEKVQLLTNPGGSAVTLTTGEGMFPALTHLACYSVDGRLLGEMGMEDYTPATPIHLPDLPVGIHLIVVTDGVYRKTLRYVKTY